MRQIKNKVRHALKVKEKIEALEYERKQLYQQYADALDLLLSVGFRKLKLRGHVVLLVDNFEHSHTQFRTTSFRRYDIEKRRT